MQTISFSRPFMGEEEAKAVANVIQSHWIVGGPQLSTLEQKFAEICNAPFAIGVSSWTTGAFLALKALGIGPGDEVIVPSLTFIASVNVIAHTGATPVFADIDPDTWNIDPKDIEDKITPKTKLILPVDQIGLPCDMDAINKIASKHHLFVLQDAACSFASYTQDRPIGSLCDITIFSLHARKIITTGEGGMIVTQNAEFAKKLKRLRHQGMSTTDFERHGSSPTLFESYPEIGYNFRLTDLQAAVGVVQIERLQAILSKRRAIALRYQEYLKNHQFLVAPVVPKGLQPNWQSYQIRVREDAPFTRNELMEKLYQCGIPTRRGVMASHLEPPYLSNKNQLPHTEHAALYTLQLPIHPALDTTEQDYIIEKLEEITTRKKERLYSYE